MRRNKKIASLILSAALATSAGTLTALAGTTGVAAIDFSLEQSGIGPMAGTTQLSSDTASSNEVYNLPSGAAVSDAGSLDTGNFSATGAAANLPNGGTQSQPAGSGQLTNESLSYDDSINTQFLKGTYTAATGAVIIGPESAINTENLTSEQNSALDQYFQNSVIVGNSIGNGFALYTKKHSDDPVLRNFQSLTANGFYIEGAFEDISTTSRHPFYQGQQRFVWDSIKLMGAKHVFLSFGTTEVQFPTVLADYQKLINQIKAVNPDVDITVISATYIYPGKYYGTMTSANVKSFNQSMEQICIANGWNFINVADRLKDQNGDLNPIYSSDEYIHQNDQAYDIWTAALKELGLKKLGMA